MISISLHCPLPRPPSRKNHRRRWGHEPARSDGAVPSQHSLEMTSTRLREWSGNRCMKLCGDMLFCLFVLRPDTVAATGAVLGTRASLLASISACMQASLRGTIIITIFVQGFCGALSRMNLRALGLVSLSLTNCCSIDLGPLLAHSLYGFRTNSALQPFLSCLILGLLGSQRTI